MADGPQLKQTLGGGLYGAAEQHLIMTPQLKRTVDPDEVQRETLLPQRGKKKE